jgi:hypothetical protein
MSAEFTWLCAYWAVCQRNDARQPEVHKEYLARGRVRANEGVADIATLSQRFDCARVTRNGTNRNECGYVKYYVMSRG